jgi:DNA-binding beta-propeller fold protein YncE
MLRRIAYHSIKLLFLVRAFVCGCCENLVAELPRVECVAGTGAPTNNGDSGPAEAINIGDPFGVEFGPDGALYITEVRNHRIRRLDIKTRKLTTVAGCGRRGYSGDGCPAVNAELNEPYEVRFDPDGNMFIVEMMNHIVRRVDGKTGLISTVAGNGRQGFDGDGGPAAQALFNQPHSIALDGKRALYVADIGNHRIRRIDLKTGIIESIAGNAQRRLPQDGQVARGNPILGPRALYVDGHTLWIALREGHSIWRMNLTDGILGHVAGTGQVGFAGDGESAAEAKFNGPKGIAVAPDGNVFVVDSENNAIRRIDLKSGVIATIAGGGSDNKGGSVHTSRATNAQLKRPHGLCIASGGTIFIGDTLNHRICRVHLRAL